MLEVYHTAVRVEILIWATGAVYFEEDATVLLVEM